MYTKIQVTFDAAEPEKLAEFWGLALGYVVEPPPEGFESWDDFAASAGIPEAEWGEVASRVDPAGEGPRLYFQRVPEGKTAKNRMHFDLRAPGPVAAEVARLEGLGATVAQRHEGYTVMRDPEGNEFCVEPGPAPYHAGTD